MVTYTNILTFSSFNSEHKEYKGDLTMESVFDHIMVILAIPLGLFIFLILLSWIIALAADPYAGLPNEKDRKAMLKNRKNMRRNKDAL